MVHRGGEKVDPVTLGAVGILALSAIEIVALYKGINGKAHTAVAAAIVGVVGFAFGVGVS